MFNFQEGDRVQIDVGGITILGTVLEPCITPLFDYWVKLDAGGETPVFAYELRKVYSA